jgi:hypothetical protein
VKGGDERTFATALANCAFLTSTHVTAYARDDVHVGKIAFVVIVVVVGVGACPRGKSVEGG